MSIKTKHERLLNNRFFLWKEALLNTIFPDRCLVCRSLLSTASGPPLCERCQQSFTPVGRICVSCSRVFEKRGDSCCPVQGAPLQGLFALTWYGKKWRNLLHALKYRGNRALARPMGRWLGQEVLSGNWWAPDIVVPVPMHKSRFSERGYNQSALLAGHAARVLGIPSAELLVKAQRSPAQTGLSRLDRHTNVSGIFSCSKQPLAGSTVLLIDDIYTTGATMKEAAKELASGGALVYGAVIAYNPRINRFI